LASNLFQKICPVLAGSSFGDRYHALSCQWFAGEENIAYTATLVFIIVLADLSETRNYSGNKSLKPDL